MEFVSLRQKEIGIHMGEFNKFDSLKTVFAGNVSVSLLNQVKFFFLKDK